MRIKQQLLLFVVRWMLNSLALWISVRLLGNVGAELTASNTLLVFIFAGLLLSLVNVVIRPLLIILALPFILVTLGLFMLVVNGIVVYLAIKLSPGLHMEFGASILAGIIVSLVNYILTGTLQMRREEKES